MIRGIAEDEYQQDAEEMQDYDAYGYDLQDHEYYYQDDSTQYTADLTYHF